MAEIIDDIAYLTQEIGPHPAGTEEEQRAALYLADQMQKEAGFATVVEDFQCTTNDQLPSIICFGVALLSAVLSIVVPSLGVLWLILSIVAAVLYGMEITGRPVLSRLFRTGASQNVVAKYQPTPAEGANARRRKIVLVANYDSGKVLAEEKPPFAAALPIVQKASAIALVVSAVILLLRVTVFAADTGAMSSILTFLLVICAVLFALPLVRSVLHIVAPFNQSANNNASGVSVLLDVARKVGNGLVSQEEALERSAEEGNQVHGEAAARAAGVVPEGASLEYETEMSPQESLAAAKAAIAALTGKPVADKVPVTDISSRLVKGGGLIAEDEDAVSGVHFEVGKRPERPEPAPNPLARTMVSSTLDEEKKAEESSGEKDEVIIPKHQLAKKQAAEVAAAAAAEAAKQAARPAPAPEPPRSHAGDTPSWAKIAQEKARANKPDTGQAPKVSRSRYADTAAARMMEHHASNPYGSPVRVPEPEPVQSELSSKVQALQSEIESFGTPRSAAAPQAVPAAEPAVEPVDAEAEKAWHQNNSAVAPVVRKPAPAPIAPPAPWLERKPEPEPVAAPEPSVEPAAAQVQEIHQVKEPAPEPAPAKPTPVSHEALYEAAMEEIDQLAEAATESVQQPEAPVSTPEAKAVPVEPAAEAPVSQPVVESAAEPVEEHVAEQAPAVFERRKPTPRPTVRHSQRLHHTAHKKHEVEEIEEEVASNTAPMEPVESPVEATGELPVTPSAAESEVFDEPAEPAHHGGSFGEFLNNAMHTGAEKASQMQHSFASRLKSITSRKPHKEEEPYAPVSEEQYDDSYADEVAYDQPEEFSAQQEPPEPVDDAYAESQQEAAAPVSPSATTSISPIDVSQFMDTEKFDDEEEMPIRRIDESVERTVVSYDDVDAGSTGRMYTDEVQAAQDAYPYGYDEEYGEYAVSAAEQTAPQPAVASPIVGMDEMVSPVAPSVEAEDDRSYRQVIVLPDVAPARNAAGDAMRQRAPMAEVNENSTAGSKSLLSNMLPRIDSSATGSFSAAPAPRSLDLPSFDTGSQSAVSATGSFSTVGGTGSFAPVGDELVSDIAPEERYVDDADDSAYDEEYTETGAFAGPGYVDMPKSRAGRLFDRFRKNKKRKQEEVSVNEWVDVDESYNARSVGKARGDWSSFREEQDDFVDVDYRESDNRRGWNGGAFSLNRLRKGEEAAPEEAYADGAPAYEGEEFVESNPALRIDGDAGTAEQINRELKKLQDFRHPDIDTEVWFVGLGAEQYSHSGINAFLEEHADEMKGAIIVNLEALGAGSLSCIEQEGAYKPYKVSSRLKRVLRQASERSGVGYHTDRIVSRETPASIAMSQGIQAITIAGMAEGNTALYSADNDIIENIDPQALEDASNFVMAILKSM